MVPNKLPNSVRSRAEAAACTLKVIGIHRKSQYNRRDDDDDDDVDDDDDDYDDAGDDYDD